jgi:hypothetical protein
MNSYLFEYSCKNIKLYSFLISLFCLTNLLLIFPDYIYIYVDNSYIPAKFNGFYIPKYYLNFSHITELSQTIGLNSKTTILILLSLYFFSLLSIILDFYKFIFSIAALLLHTMMINSSNIFSYGADFFINFALFLNIFFSYSGKNNIILKSFIQRLTQIHLCVIYFFAGLGKLFGVDWINGSAFWKISHLYFVEYISFKNLPSAFYLLSSLFVVILQTSYSILVNIKYTRVFIFYCIILLHLMIAITMQFYTFGTIMILLNYIAWGNYINIDFKPLKKYRFNDKH